MDDHPTLDELENLFVNNADLARIETYINRFNPIRVMKMQSMEIRHSAILSWLLTPAETHGLGDAFLKAFLSEALRGQSGKARPNALEVSQADLRDATARCEWKHIDILIVSSANNWAFIVENKFYSTQREGQLAGYVKSVRSSFQNRNDDFRIRGIFLTLWDEEPHDANYSPISYETVCELLIRSMQQHAHLLSTEVQSFLTHYVNILKEETGMSEHAKEMERLARQLYREHRKVLDFVVQHGTSTDFAFAARDLFGEEPEAFCKVTIGKQKFAFCWLGNSQVSFLPWAWYEAFGEDDHAWSGCEDWWSGFPVIVWFEIAETGEGTEGQLKLYAEVGPISDHAFRKDLIESIQQVAEKQNLSRIKFQSGAANEGKRFSKFFRENSQHVNDVNDSEEIAKVMKELLRSFRAEFEAVESVLPQFIEYAT